MTDTTGQLDDKLGDTARSLGTRTLPDGAEAHVLSIARTYAGDVEDIWGAVTEAERIARWFMPVSGDLKVGGRYQLQGNAEGEVLTCEPPTSYSVTWEYGGDVSWVEVELTPVAGDRTRFELRHIARPGDHWKTYGPGAVGIGWDLGLYGLAKHLATGEPLDQAAEAAWLATEDGRRLMTASGEGWYAADVARGTDPATARAAADHTIAAYLGEESPAP
jgi:uncharacterized protein YndB with AHSA1/START domain